MPSRLFRVGRSATGLGLFATKPIKRAAYIATYRGRRISTEEADRRLARGASYIFELNSRWSIDGSPRRNVARYINHSCRSNAKPVHRNGGIVIVALSRIEPGEEITYDYGRAALSCGVCRGRLFHFVPVMGGDSRSLVRHFNLAAVRPRDVMQP